jgi:hypothetical protein
MTRRFSHAAVIAAVTAVVVVPSGTAGPTSRSLVAERTRDLGSLPRSEARAELDGRVSAPTSGATDIYVDPTGDNEAGLGPDITVTTITSTPAGFITVDAETPNEPTLLSGSDFFFFMDTDRNPLTGSSTGSEYVIDMDGATQTYGLARWNGAWHGVAAPTLQASWSSGPTIQVNRSDLGGTTGFNFWEAATWRSVSTGTTYTDFAPDGAGTWSYTLVAPPPPPPPPPPAPPAPLPQPPPPPPPVDRTAPNTRITGAPARMTTSTRATFRFFSTEAGSIFECRLDGGLWRACAAPKTYRNLRLGFHTFRVRARDRAGNVDATAATRTWRIRRPRPQRHGRHVGLVTRPAFRSSRISTAARFPTR